MSNNSNNSIILCLCNGSSYLLVEFFFDHRHCTRYDGIPRRNCWAFQPVAYYSRVGSWAGVLRGQRGGPNHCFISANQMFKHADDTIIIPANNTQPRDAELDHVARWAAGKQSEAEQSKIHRNHFQSLRNAIGLPTCDSRYPRVTSINILVYGHFGIKTLRHRCRSVRRTLRHQCLSVRRTFPVSYTHLTLPTIYSV